MTKIVAGLSAVLGALLFPLAIAETAPFDTYDRNRDGVLNSDELVSSLGTEIFEQLDADQSGSVSRSEFERAGNLITVRTQSEIVCPDGSIDRIDRVITRDLNPRKENEIEGMIEITSPERSVGSTTAPCGFTTLEEFQTHILPQLRAEY